MATCNAIKSKCSASINFVFLRSSQSRGKPGKLQQLKTLKQVITCSSIATYRFVGYGWIFAAPALDITVNDNKYRAATSTSSMPCRSALVERKAQSLLSALLDNLCTNNTIDNTRSQATAASLGGGGQRHFSPLASTPVIARPGTYCKRRSERTRSSKFDFAPSGGKSSKTDIGSSCTSYVSSRHSSQSSSKQSAQFDLLG